MATQDSPEYLENYEHHAIFTINYHPPGIQTEQPCYLDLFAAYTTGDFKSAMMAQIQSNVNSEGTENKSSSSLLSEVSAMKVAALFRNSSPLLCIHAEFALDRGMLENYIHSFSRQELGEFIQSSKLKC